MFICFVCFCQLTAIVSVKNINHLVFIIERVCLVCDMKSIFVYYIDDLYDLKGKINRRTAAAAHENRLLIVVHSLLERAEFPSSVRPSQHKMGQGK